MLVQVGEIDWIEAAGNYVRLHVGQERHLLRETMRRWKRGSTRSASSAVHRSTIVNLERVRELEPYFHGDYVLKLTDGTRLTLSRTYRDHLQERLGRDL